MKEKTITMNEVTIQINIKNISYRDQYALVQISLSDSRSKKI